MKKSILIILVCCFFFPFLLAQKQVTEEVMTQIYEKVKTPYKYGLVLAPDDNRHKIDCPTVFRKNGKWYMSYLVYDGKDGKDGRGYETWLAESDDLLHWQTLGRILSFPETGSGRWDENQRAGYVALIDYEWGGSYEPQLFEGKYWMSYFGGIARGYEQGCLEEGIACTENEITKAHEWKTFDKPILSPSDKKKGWWENITQYKSSVIWDKKKTLGHPFVMYYNAAGINPANQIKAERIGIALSDDMKHWKRYKNNPVLNHEEGITGDGVIQQIGDIYVMFYFGAFWKSRPYKAFNTFACSYDLVHWTDWTGEDLIIPSEKQDNRFAHKSSVIQWNDTVYHFYCAVNEDDQRGIALAVSQNKGKSLLRFPKPDKETFRKEIVLNEHWKTIASDTTDAHKGFETIQYQDTQWETVDIPHNWDKYEGARRLKHGNRHGTAWYRKTFRVENQGENKRYFLFFEGVSSFATVYLNGKQVGSHAGGRTSFTIDITDAVDFIHDNVLAVQAKHPPMITNLPWVCGGCSSEWGFSEGSQPMGIFRPVTLIVSNDVKIEPFGVHAWNPVPEFQNGDTLFTLHVNTEMKNYSSQVRNLEVIQKLINKEGKQITRINTKVNIQPFDTKLITQKSEPVENPHLWNTRSPYLHKLITIIKENGTVIDQETTPYGFRWISWPKYRDDGDNRFFLNGEPVFINGVCEYEHLLGQSHAFSEEQIQARVNQIKAAGFNAFRDAHQPHNLLYQQLLDKFGILFWTQFSAHIWYDTPEFRNNFKNNLREWIKERRSCPSIILWGLQNESVLPEDFARECTEIIREMDPTSPSQRLVTTCNGGSGADWNVVQNWSGTYGGNPENYAAELSRKEQLLNGEYGAWRSIGLHTEGDFEQNGLLSEDRMCRLLEMKIRLAEQAKDSVCGQFQWIYSSHDNPGRIQNEESVRDIDRIGPFNYKGLLTPWEEPLDAYYMYRSNYISKQEAPMVYLVSHTWNDRWKDAGKKDGIIVYSNCDEVELFNDVKSISLGKRNRKGTGTHFQWQGVEIRYNLLYAVGYVDGKIVAEDYIVMDNFPISPHFEQLYKEYTNLLAPQEKYHYLYRVNCGGEEYTDKNNNTWSADVSKKQGNYWGSLSWASEWDYLPDWLASQGRTNDPVKGVKDWKLFQTFRYGRDKLKYRFPLPNGEYLVELYFIEPWWGTDRSLDCEGFRLFDVSISGNIVLKNLDIWKEAGHDSVLKKMTKGKADNGWLEIAFPRVKAGQAILSAIAIASIEDTIVPAPPSPLLLPDSTKINPAAVEEPDLRRPVIFKSDSSTKSEISWTITPGLAGEYALRFKYMNKTEKNIVTRIKILSSDGRVMRDDSIQFPPTPAKWRTISTTTSVPINAGRYKVILSDDYLEDLELDTLEMQ